MKKKKDVFLVCFLIAFEARLLIRCPRKTDMACEIAGELYRRLSNEIGNALFSHSDDGVVDALRDVIEFAMKSKVHQESLGASGTCEQLVLYLRKRGKSSKATEFVLLAIAMLCRRDTDQLFTACIRNISRFSEGDACPHIIEALREFSSDPGVTLAAFKVIPNICTMSQRNKLRMQECGVNDAVVCALQIHIDYAAVVEQGCWVATYLACDHPENKVRLRK
jgi:hypothetical protein